ncbi:MAG TPA: DUF1559 domain-containing protein [Pirellulales bacterium]|nr:DUF1559 domain-containing protein [Pirellulales bacterium]
MVHAHRRPAFTLIELLVVIAIIGILIALLLPAVQAAREASRRSQCSNNLKQIGIGLQTYYDTCHHFPPSRWGGTAGKVYSTHPLLLPFIEQPNVYKLIDFTVLWSDPLNTQARATIVPTFLCPSDPQSQTPAGWAGNNYHGCEGSNLGMSNGVFYHTSGTRTAEILDGLSNTAAFSERLKGDWSNALVTPSSDMFKPGTNPANEDIAMNTCRALDVTNLAYQGWSNSGAPWLAGTPDDFVGYQHVAPPGDRGCHFPPGASSRPPNSAHPGGVNLLRCDGSGDFISQGIDILVWRALGSRAGFEAMNP